jgi:hypothetical protein
MTPLAEPYFAYQGEPAAFTGEARQTGLAVRLHVLFELFAGRRPRNHVFLHRMTSRPGLVTVVVTLVAKSK